MKIDGKLQQPRPQGFSLKKWVGKNPGDEVEVATEETFYNEAIGPSNKLV